MSEDICKKQINDNSWLYIVSALSVRANRYVSNSDQSISPVSVNSASIAL